MCGGEGIELNLCCGEGRDKVKFYEKKWGWGGNVVWYEVN